MRLLLTKIQNKNENSIELAFRGLERLELNERKGENQ